MAGGKETPRQKMIGMMYLVLTALLALNVSKSVLDAFVAIEENIQVTNENEYTRGQEKYFDILATTQDKTQPDLQKKAVQLMEAVKKINDITAQRILEIDDLKLKILDACGEDIQSVGKESSIIVDMNKDYPLKPIRMNLDHVLAQDNYDVPMRILIGEDIKRPGGEGIKLWNSYNGYREELTELIAGSMPAEEGQKPFYFEAPKINAFRNFEDLNKQIEEAIGKSHVSIDDKEAIKKIYASLTKREYSEVHEIKGVHWIGKTFDHSPAVAAIASLSSMQKEILTARADAVSLIASRISADPYSFDKIMPLAFGPDIVNANEDLELQVLMVAYNSLREPKVTTSRGDVADIHDGKAFVHINSGAAGELNISGEISINNKSGIPKTMPWSKTIKVMQPAGTVSLMEMNIMYRGYDNKIEAVASGYEQTILTGSNVKITKKDGRYSCAPGPGNSCKIAISGYNSTTGKKVLLGTYDYKVTTLPDPSLKLGSLTSGSSAGPSELRHMTRLFAFYPPSIPLNAKFEVISYDLSVDGAPRDVKGSGSSLSADALNLIRAAKKGSKIKVTATVRCSDNSTRFANGVYIVR